MARASATAAPPALEVGFQPALDYSATLVESLILAQRAQLEALISWQKSIASLNQELWDEWTARWGGGAPIDA